MIKHKIIICLLTVAAMAIPLIIFPMLSPGLPQPQWWHYVIVFINMPIMAWIVLTFGFKKMKEQQENENKNK